LPLCIGFLFFKTNSIEEISGIFTLAVIGASALTVTILVPWAILPGIFKNKNKFLFNL
jgi:hypothetical protein